MLNPKSRVQVWQSRALQVSVMTTAQQCSHILDYQIDLSA